MTKQLKYRGAEPIIGSVLPRYGLPIYDPVTRKYTPNRLASYLIVDYWLDPKAVFPYEYILVVEEYVGEE